jgi:hypothetical protein
LAPSVRSCTLHCCLKARRGGLARSRGGRHPESSSNRGGHNPRKRSRNSGPVEPGRRPQNDTDQLAKFVAQALSDYQRTRGDVDLAKFLNDHPQALTWSTDLQKMLNQSKHLSPPIQSFISLPRTGLLPRTDDLRTERAIPRADLLESHVPPDLTEAERRRIAKAIARKKALDLIILAADIDSSTTLMNEARDPYTFASTLEDFTGKARETIWGQRGFFDKFTGDGGSSPIGDSLLAVSPRQ